MKVSKSKILSYINNLLARSIIDTKPYTPEVATSMVKLDAMESPFSLNNTMQQQWLNKLAQVKLNLYPAHDFGHITTLLRNSFNISNNLAITLGNGSDELIQLICLAVKSKIGSKYFLAPEPSFSMYKRIACITNLEYMGVPLNEDFSLNINSMLDVINRYQPAIIFLSIPNNPTGNIFDPLEVNRIITLSLGLVVIDEAYFPFCESNYLDHLQRYPNVIIIRSLSKIGFASIRCGFLIGRQEWVEQLDKIRLPYNINSLTQASLEYILTQYDTFAQQAKLIKHQIQIMQQELNQIPFIQTYPTATNFVLIKILGYPAVELDAYLKQHNILTKCLDGYHKAITNCLRISCGTVEQNKLLLQHLNNFIK